MQSSRVDFEPVVNPQELLQQVDPKLFDMFKGGAELHVWRTQFPHVWQLSKAGEPDKVLHQWTAGDLPPEAFLAFAKQLPSPPLDEKTEAETHIFHIGQSAHESWAYDEAIYLACVQRWDTAVACAQEFNQLEGTQKIDLEKLPEASLPLVRTLKRSGVAPMVPSNVSFYEVLCSMGLARVIPRGYILATELLKKIRVPYAGSSKVSHQA